MSKFITVLGIKVLLDHLPDQLADSRLTMQNLLADDGAMLDRQSKKSRLTDGGIYVLNLDDGVKPFIYVGKSTDITLRLQQHANGNGGAAVVTGRAFTRIPTVVKGSIDDMEGWERAEVLELMYQYGIDAVRGWKFTLRHMPLHQKLSAFDDVCERFDLCRKCGRGTHFIKDCRSLTTDHWTNGLELRSAYKDDQLAKAQANADNERAARVAAEKTACEERDARIAAERRNTEAARILLNK